jgi:PAS domain S-box-containing protein
MKTDKDSEKNEKLLLTIFNSMSEGVVLIDSNGIIVKANPSAEKILGLSVSEIEGRLYDSPNWHMIRQDGSPMPIDEMAGPLAMIKKKSVNNIVMGFVKQDQSISWINVSAVPIISQDGTIENVIGTFIDITEKKNAEDELKVAKEALQSMVREQTQELEQEIKFRKHAEINLKAREAFLDRIIEQSPFATWISDAEGTLIRANPALKKYLNLSDEQLVGKYNVLQDPLIERQGLLPLVRSVFEKGETIYFTAEWDGNDIPSLNLKGSNSVSIDATMFPIFDSEGQLTNVVLNWIDISKRKRAEKALIESERRYRSLFEFMEEGFLRADINGYIIMANLAIAKMCGYQSPDEMIGIHTTSLYANSEEREKILQAIHKKGKAHNYEIMLCTKDGRHFCSLSNIKLLKNDHGEILGTEGLIRDITDRKKAENALKESEEKFRQIYEHMSIGIAKVSLDYKILNANEAYCQMLGYEENYLIGKHLKDITSPETSEENLLKQSQLATGTIDHFRMEKKFIHKNGSVIHGILDSNLVRDAHGNPSYFLGSVLDITERNKLEKQVQQTQKMEAIGTLAGGIAHDFNNILNVFTGNISYALSCIQKDDELFDVLSDVMLGTKQAEDLTHQLLTFAKGGEPIKKLCNINSILEKASRFVTSGAKSKCEFNLANDLWTAEVDPGQLNQVISNLVINADQSMPNGGIIRIKSENTVIHPDSIFPLPCGQYVKISIEDKGVGIREEHLSTIFDPYFTTKNKGNGLGLTTSYSIINRHSGHISVYSEIDLGTVFSIFLPASKQNFMEPAVIKESKHKGHGKILVMDDQEPILKMIGRMLKRMGYEVDFASDGDQAIQVYQKAYQKQKPFDLVILDLTIPGGMGGADTMVELLKIDPQVKAVVSSGYSNDPIMANYQNYGFCGVVPKPYTKNELSEVLNKIF